MLYRGIYLIVIVIRLCKIRSTLPTIYRVAVSIQCCKISDSWICSFICFTTDVLVFRQVLLVLMFNISFSRKLVVDFLLKSSEVSDVVEFVVMGFRSFSIEYLRKIFDISQRNNFIFMPKRIKYTCELRFCRIKSFLKPGLHGI